MMQGLAVKAVYWGGLMGRAARVGCYGRLLRRAVGWGGFLLQNVLNCIKLFCIKK